MILASKVYLRLIENRYFLLLTCFLLIHINNIDAWNYMIYVWLSNLTHVFATFLGNMNLCLSYFLRVRCSNFVLHRSHFCFFLFDSLIKNFLKSSKHVYIFKMSTCNGTLKLLSTIIIIIYSFIINKFVCILLFLAWLFFLLVHHCFVIVFISHIWNLYIYNYN